MHLVRYDRLNELAILSTENEMLKKLESIPKCKKEEFLNEKYNIKN